MICLDAKYKHRQFRSDAVRRFKDAYVGTDSCDDHGELSARMNAAARRHMAPCSELGICRGRHADLMVRIEAIHTSLQMTLVSVIEVTKLRSACCLICLHGWGIWVRLPTSVFAACGDANAPAALLNFLGGGADVCLKSSPLTCKLNGTFV